MSSSRPVDDFVKRSLNILQNKYVAVGKGRMSVLTLSILVTFVAGMIAAVGLLASRSGTFEGSSAAGGFTVSGKVFEDADENGVFDEGEEVVVGQTVTLRDKLTGQVIYQSTVTDSNGAYRLSGISPGIGIYRVTSLVPSGYVKTTDDSKPVDITSDITVNFGIMLELGTAQNFQSSAAATTQVFQASTDFSSTQAQKGWYYLDESGNPLLAYYASYAQCGSSPCWKGSGDYQLVYASGQHPGPTQDSLRGWMAPGNGSVRITGTVKDTGGICGGDGVNVKIKQDPNILWQASLNDGDTMGKSFDVTSNVSSGQIIYFMVNKGSLNNWCDWTTFDPKIEFTPGGSGPPPPTTKTTVYKLSEQFSAQGAGTQWVYMDGGRRALTYYTAGQHPECGASACRHGEENFQMIGPGWMSPGHRSNLASPTVLEWQAPEAGYAKITGSVQLKNPSCSDGVEVDTPFNSRIVIPAKNGQAYSYSGEGGVAKGQSFAFKMAKGSPSQNNNCDTVVLDPTITFTQAVSVQPDLSVGLYRPTSATEGAKVRFTAQVIVGAVAGTRQYITANFYIDNQLIGSKRTRMSMRAGSRATFSLPLTNTWAATKGTHTLRIVVDPDNALAESNEGNNTLTATFVVKSPSPGSNDRLTVKKVFLPSVSAAVTVTLDGASPAGSTADTVYWDNVSAGSHTVTVSGAPKTFYTVCPGASECSGGPIKDGSSILFSHQLRQNDAIRLIFGSATAHLKKFKKAFETGEPGAGFVGINMSADEFCSINMVTDISSGPQWDTLQQSANAWSQSYIKVKVTHNPSPKPVPISDEERNNGVGDDVFSSIRFVGIAGDKTYGLTIYNSIEDIDATYFPNADIIINSGTLAKIFSEKNLNSSEQLRAYKMVVAHEIGHLLGLDDKSTKAVTLGGSVMITDVDLDINVRSSEAELPTLTDIEAVNGLYEHCAPKPKPPAKLSLTFTQNPAVWSLLSPTGKSICQNGQTVIPNGYWTSYLELKETGGQTGVTIEGAKLEQYGQDGKLKNTQNFSGKIVLKPGARIADSYYVPPNKNFSLKKEIVTFFGKDDLGNAMEVSASVDFGDVSRRLGSCGYPDGTWGNGQGGGGSGWGGGGWGGGGSGGGPSYDCPNGDVCLEHEWEL